MTMTGFQKRSIELFPDTPDHDHSELLKTIKVPKNLMYLSNRLPMANYDFKGRKNHTVKIPRSINAKYIRPTGQEAVIRIQRGSAEANMQSDEQKPLKNHLKNQPSIASNEADRQSTSTQQDYALPKISSKVKLSALEQQSTIDTSEPAIKQYSPPGGPNGYSPLKGRAQKYASISPPNKVSHKQ